MRFDTDSSLRVTTMLSIQTGSRLTTPRGRELFIITMQAQKLQQLSTDQLTYLLTDKSEIPNVIDFCVTKCIASNYIKAEACVNLSSDHSPIIIQ